MRMVLRMAAQDYANCIYIASTRESAKRLAWKDLKRIIATLHLSGVKCNESELTCTFPNGASLLLFGADAIDDIEKLRGITWHEVAIDEVASIKVSILQYLLYEVIGPRAVGSIVLLGTPGKRLEGLFYDVTRPGSDQHRRYVDRELPEYADWKKWSSHNWSIEDGVAAGISAMTEINVAQLADKERNGWSDDNPIWLRERKAQWAADDTLNVYLYRPHKDGQPWNQWDPVIDGQGFAVLPTDLKDVAYAVGMDVGFKDVFAIEIFAFSYSDPRRTLWHVYEFYRTRQYANAIAKLLIGENLDHSRYGGIVRHIGWPAVMVGDFARAGGPLLTELKNVYGIAVAEASKPYAYKENSIELTNSMFHEGQIKVLKGSNLEQELTSLQWVVDQYGKRTENKAQANHAGDSLIYLRDAVAPLLAGVTAAPPTSSTVAVPAPVDDDPPRSRLDDDEPDYNIYSDEI